MSDYHYLIFLSAMIGGGLVAWLFGKFLKWYIEGDL